MTLKVHQSAAQIRNQRARLLALQLRFERQIADADCLIATLEEYCRENPDDCACAANDPAWQHQLARQREDLAAMLLAVRQKLK
jgi:phage shock protein A